MFSVSATKLTLYKECRLRYYHKYVLQQPEPDTTALIFGRAVHTAVEAYYTQSEQDPVRVFLETFEHAIAHSDETCIVYEPPDLLRAIGEVSLASFPWHLYQPTHIEYSFSVPLTDDIQLEGRFDMITADGYIVDIKTGKRIGSLHDSIQFTLYAYAYEQLFGHPPAGVIWHHFRNHHQIVVPTEVLQNALPAVLTLAGQLRDDTFENMAQCAWCPPYCPFRRGGYDLPS